MGDLGILLRGNGGGRPRRSGYPDRFTALADPTRRHLLAVLSTNDCTVSELTAGLDISQPAVSQHLKILRETGLVEYHCTGRNHYYHLCIQSVHELCDWVLGLEQSSLEHGVRESAARPGHLCAPNDVRMAREADILMNLISEMRQQLSRLRGRAPVVSGRVSNASPEVSVYGS